MENNANSAAITTAQTIRKYCDSYTSGFGQMNIVKTYLSSPTLLLFSNNTKKQAQALEAALADCITNPQAVRLSVADDAENVISCCNDFLSCGNATGINAVIILCGEDSVNVKSLHEKAVNTIRERLGKAISITFYSICLLDELGSADNCKNALDAISEISMQETVILLGRRRLSGRIISTDSLEAARTQIIANLIINTGSIHMDCGAYSIGIAQLDSCAEVYWHKALASSLNSVQITRNSISEKNLYEDIENSTNSGYSVTLSSDIMKNIICQKPNNLHQGSIKDYIRALYGEALDVYLNHERDKADAAVAGVKEKITLSISELLKSTDVEIENEDRVIFAINNKIIALKEQLTSVGDLNSSVISDYSDSIKKDIFDKYLMPQAMNIANSYYQKCFSEVFEIVKDAFTRHSEKLKALSTYRTYALDEVINYINSEEPLNLVVNIKCGVNGNISPDKYIESLCQGLNDSLLSTSAFDGSVNEHLFNYKTWLLRKAEPFCRNAISEIIAAYYVLGNTDFANKIIDPTSNVNLIPCSYLKNEVIINCSKINLQMFKNMI